jgi:hypothetical protein
MGCVFEQDQPLSRYVHLAQDSFYRDLTPEEQMNIGNFNFDHPSVSKAARVYESSRELVDKDQDLIQRVGWPPS